MTPREWKMVLLRNPLVGSFTVSRDDLIDMLVPRNDDPVIMDFGGCNIAVSLGKYGEKFGVGLTTLPESGEPGTKVPQRLVDTMPAMPEVLMLWDRESRARNVYEMFGGDNVCITKDFADGLLSFFDKQQPRKHEEHRLAGPYCVGCGYPTQPANGMVFHHASCPAVEDPFKRKS